MCDECDALQVSKVSSRCLALVGSSIWRPRTGRCGRRLLPRSGRASFLLGFRAPNRLEFLECLRSSLCTGGRVVGFLHCDRDNVKAPASLRNPWGDSIGGRFSNIPGAATQPQLAHFGISLRNIIGGFSEQGLG